MNTYLSNQEKNFIIDGIQDGVRNDGRGLFDYRPIYFETGVLATTNGSAKVQVDNTVVLVGVRADIVERDSSECPNKLRFFVDFSAVASPAFVGRGGNEYGEELSSILANAYDNDDSIGNISKLIISDKYMWTVYVDIVVLRCGGSVMDAASIGVKAALATAEICEMIVRPADQGKQILDLPDNFKTWKLDLSRAPLVIGVTKIGEHSVVDATIAEESCSTGTLFVAVKPANCEGINMDDEASFDANSLVLCVRKSREGCLDVESIEDMLNTAVRASLPLNRAIETRLRDEAKSIADSRELGGTHTALNNIMFP